MRSMWLSADITLSDMSGSFVGRDPRVRASVVPLAHERKNPELRAETARLTRSCQSGSSVASGAFVAGDPKLREPFSLILWKSGIRWHFACSMLSSPRAWETIDAPTAEETMGLAKRVIAALLLTGAAALLLASSVLAQERVGVVTNIEGTATVARLTLPQAQPLHFKDDVFLRDRIATGERSFVRVLLGGKATVTARERSVLTITEVPGVSTIQLGEGRISVAVSKGLMKPGEVIEIKTPNAVTAIRGTVVVAEVVPTPEGHRSTITILKGLVDVTKLDSAGQLSGSAVKLGALERVTVTNSPAVPRPETITQEAAKKLASDFSHIPKNAPAATLDALNADVKENSIREATQTLGGNGSDTRPSVNTVGATGSSTTSSGNTTGAVGTTVTGVTGAAGMTLTGVTGAVGTTLTGVTGSTTPTVAPTVTNPITNLVTTVTNTTTTVTNGLLNGLLKK